MLADLLVSYVHSKLVKQNITPVVILNLNVPRVKTQLGKIKQS